MNMNMYIHKRKYVYKYINRERERERYIQGYPDEQRRLTRIPFKPRLNSCRALLTQSLRLWAARAAAVAAKLTHVHEQRIFTYSAYGYLRWSVWRACLWSKPWDVTSATCRSFDVAPRVCARVYARVRVPPNIYIHTYIPIAPRLTSYKAFLTQTFPLCAPQAAAVAAAAAADAEREQQVT